MKKYQSQKPQEYLRNNLVLHTENVFSNDYQRVVIHVRYHGHRLVVERVGGLSVDRNDGGHQGQQQLGHGGHCGRREKGESLV